MEIEFQIAAQDFAVTHSELHHYTNFKGLQGIVESNSLWATHFSHLNDSSEVLLLKQPLINALVPRAQASVRQGLGGLNRHARRMAARRGPSPVPAADITRAFVDAMYGAAFQSTVVAPLAEPYIASFCAHSPEQSYEIANGLLSQWRAYGVQERYCVVFDTSNLIAALSQEFDRYYWIYVRLSEVRYNATDVSIETLFPELIESSARHLIEAFSGRRIQISPEAMVGFFSAAPRFKHQGFKEEQEVRIIAIPGKQSTVDLIRGEHPDHVMAPLKEVRTRETPSGACPYLALFDGLEAPLPIKRVIIGPSRRQKEDLARARCVTKSLPLHLSETPFLG